MLRSLTRNVAVQRSAPSLRRVDWHYSVRLISTAPNASENSSASKSTSSSSPSQPTLHRKVKIDLRPGPVKPKNSTLSLTHVPTKPTVPLPQPPSAPSLTSAKEASKRDIEEAETHGVLTPPPPDANWFKRMLHKAIQLTKFYYRGVKLIFIRRKHVSIIKARTRAGGSPLTRSEYRLIVLQKDDIRKVIPFIVFALLLEEVIPLIAIYMPSLLPSTCILPSQRARMHEKKTEKALAFSTIYRPLFAQLRKLENSAGQLSFEAVRQPPSPEALCGILRLSTSGIDVLRMRRIRQHLSFIAQDDQFLLRDKPSLSEKDLNEALEERGIIVQGLSLSTKQSLLKWWLESVKDADAEASFSRRLSLVISKHR